MNKHVPTKLRRIVMPVLLLFLTITLSVVPATKNAQAASPMVTAAKVRNGLVKKNGHYQYYKNGTMLRNTWKTINGAKYYFKGNGNAAIGGLYLDGNYYVFNKKGQLKKYASPRPLYIDDKVYFVDRKSMASPGWHLYGNKLFYAKKNGKCVVSKTVDGVKLNDKGYSFTAVSADTMVKYAAIKTLDAITNDKMTISEKRKACWDYLQDKTVFSYYPKYPDFNEKGWQRKQAFDMLISHQGNCYSFACAFAALTHELGDKSEVIVGSVFDGFSGSFTAHCWSRVNGNFYDPEAKFYKWADIYDSPVYTKSHKIDFPVAF